VVGGASTSAAAAGVAAAAAGGSSGSGPNPKTKVILFTTRGGKLRSSRPSSHPPSPHVHTPHRQPKRTPGWTASASSALSPCPTSLSPSSLVGTSRYWACGCEFGQDPFYPHPMCCLLSLPLLHTRCCVPTACTSTTLSTRSLPLHPAVCAPHVRARRCAAGARSRSWAPRATRSAPSAARPLRGLRDDPAGRWTTSDCCMFTGVAAAYWRGSRHYEADALSCSVRADVQQTVC
jgi:hypothetical protein